MNRILQLVLFVVCFTLVNPLKGQFSPDLNGLVNPPASPEAAAFVKYGNTPVSLYSGTPNVSVPLGAVNGRTVQIPLNLTYDASGVKVEQIATWVGLGWNMSLGGAVTRMANGLPDDYVTAQPEYEPYYSTVPANWLLKNPLVNSTNYYYNYFMDHQMSSATNPLEDVEAYGDFMKAKEQGKVDFQPDLYSFSVLDLSGTMFIDYESETGVCLEQPDLKIVPWLVDNPSGFGVKEVLGWTITDNKGTVYTFNKAELTDFKDNMDDGVRIPHDRQFYSAWYCTRIRTANGRDVIDFVYTDPQPWQNDQIISGNEVQAFLGAESSHCKRPDLRPNTESSTYNIHQFDLAEVRLNGRTRIVLERSGPTEREDLLGKSKLTGIQLYNPDGSSQNHIVLDQTYFETNGGARERDKRLRLDGVRILGANDEALAKPDMLQEYTFEYFHPQGYEVPARDSFAQDFWGYFNGQDGNKTRGVSNNGTLIPQHSSLDWSNFSGANRDVSFDHSITGTLQKINYPTGGTTEFHYQPNYVKAEASGVQNADSYYEDVRYASVPLQGQENTEDPAGGLSCGYTDNLTVAPDMITWDFTVPEDDLYKVAYRLTPQEGDLTPNKAAYAFIYKGAPKTLCDIMSNPDDPDIVFFDTDEPDHPTNSEAFGSLYLTFQADVDYHILLVSNGDDISLEVTRNELKTVTTGGGKGVAMSKVGGFRIFKIEDKASENTVAQSRYFYYDKLEERDLARLNDNFFAISKASSGILQVPLSFTSPSDKLRMNGSGVVYSCSETQRFASNKWKSKPNLVTYSTVTETVGDGSKFNGFTVSEFYNRKVATQLPYSKDLRNGKPKSESIFDEDMRMLQKSETNWERVGTGFIKGFYLQSHRSGIYNMLWEQAVSGADPLPDSYRYTYQQMGVTGISGSGWYKGGTTGGGVLPRRCDFGEMAEICLKPGEQSVYEQVIYGIAGGWLKMTDQTVTKYHKSGNQVITTNYYYDDVEEGNYNLRETSSIDSKGEEFITRYFYPQDLQAPLGEEANVYDEMVDQNRLSEVVKTQRLKNIDDTEIILQEQETQFKKQESSDDLLPDWVLYSVNGGTPEPRIQYLAHDSFGNVTWFVKDGVQSVQYAWKNGNVPEVKVTGVYVPDYEVESDGRFKTPVSRSYFLYKGYEEGSDPSFIEAGIDETPPSGKQYHRLQGNDENFNGLDPNVKYTLAFWAKGSGDATLTRKAEIEPSDTWTTESIALTSEWQYFEFELSGLKAMSISSIPEAFIDDLRLHSKESQMTTYAYDEAERLISQAGPNGMPTHYEYDALGRLRVVRDYQGNIIRLIKYGFKSVIND